MRSFFFWLPAFVWMGLIFFLSSQISVRVSETFIIQFLIFKSFHLIEYGVLYVFSYRALRNTTERPDWKNSIDAFIIAVTYGIIDELHQMFVPTREGRMRDIFIDALGISIAALILWKYLPKAPKVLKNLAKKLQIL